MLDGGRAGASNCETTETTEETTDKMKMADGSTILRRNRPGTKAKVNKYINLIEL